MNVEAVKLERTEVQKLLGAGNADTALLYLFIKAGNEPGQATQALGLSAARLNTAGAMLRQLGLWTEEKESRFLAGERPSYSERDVLEAADREPDFRALWGEVQRVLGRPLNTEELKILLGFIHYLGLPVEVISLLVTYCKERSRARGSTRNPSLRTIEKEAYAWAERGIDNLEEAAAFIQTQNLRNSRLSRVMDILQIRGRALTAAEERYAASWIELGFEEDAIALAYERTCLNTGGLNWAYMNKILQRWHEAGLHNAAAIQAGDRKPGTAPQPGQRKLDEDEIAAIRRMTEG